MGGAIIQRTVYTKYEAQKQGTKLSLAWNADSMRKAQTCKQSKSLSHVMTFKSLSSMCLCYLVLLVKNIKNMKIKLDAYASNLTHTHVTIFCYVAKVDQNDT